MIFEVCVQVFIVNVLHEIQNVEIIRIKAKCFVSPRNVEHRVGKFSEINTAFDGIIKRSLSNFKVLFDGTENSFVGNSIV